MSDHIVFCPDFNPRSREGSDFASRSHKHPRQISIHAPAKGATMMSWCWGKAIRFQSTLPRRERHRNTKSKVEKFYFNPRSREGSDLQLILLLFFCFISIHAPAKGATCRHGHMLFDKRIFQSTLPRRERPFLSAGNADIRNFNPRSREGSDILLGGDCQRRGISIHAPAKGATCMDI